MAEAAVNLKATKHEWKKTGIESSSDDEDAVIPGMDGVSAHWQTIHTTPHQSDPSQQGNSGSMSQSPRMIPMCRRGPEVRASVNKMGTGNLRPKLRARRPRGVQGKMTNQHPAAEEIPSSTSLSVQDLSQSLDERRLRPAGGVQHGQVSLKDLCVEDKQRIANLIKELARVGEEREKAREELEKERHSYEHQILKLVEQQEQILQERQEVEKHLAECQQLLAQSQQLHPPALSLPTVAPPTFVAPPPAPLIGQVYPQWAWSTAQQPGQDPHHSLIGNVGSPRGQNGLSTHPGLEGEADIYRDQQETVGRVVLPLHPSAAHNLPHTSTHTGSAGPNHIGVGIHAPQQQPVLPRHPDHAQHQQPPVDFFASALQKPEPLDMFATKGTSEPNPVLSQPNKEDVIQRFFASQTPDQEAALMSPRRREGHRSSRSKPNRGVFLPPIMSSTQKSTEIKDYLSMDSHQDYVPLAPDDSSPRSWGDSGGGEGGRRREEDGGVNRVAFREGGNKELRMHSPSGDCGDNNPTQTFRKMSHTQRKEQLLQQRAQLLEEQQRLRHILQEQENMLREKQQALDTRSHHKANMVVEDKGRPVGDEDEDPLGLVPQRLAIDAALERQRAIVDSLELEAQQRNSATKPSTTNWLPGDQGDRQTQANEEQVGSAGKGREKRETNVAPPGKLSDVVRKLDYSLHSDSEERPSGVDSDDSVDEREEDKENRERDKDCRTPPAQRQDAGTSVSYRTIPRISSSPVEAGFVEKRSPADRVFSASHPPPSYKPSAPGEKTMTVLEIINSLHSPQSRQTTATLRSTRHHHQHLSPFTHELSPSAYHHRDIHTLNKWRGTEDDDDVEIVVVDSSFEEALRDRGDKSASEEDLEESQILEDIFFLK